MSRPDHFSPSFSAAFSLISASARLPAYSLMRRRERMPEVPTSAAFSLAPDWVCEVVSPSTQSRDRVAKMRIYSRERVSHIWLVDPIAQTLEAFGAAQWIALEAQTENARAVVFDLVLCRGDLRRRRVQAGALCGGESAGQ